MNLTLLEAALWLTALLCTYVLTWRAGYRAANSDAAKDWRRNEQLRKLARRDGTKLQS